MTSVADPLPPLRFLLLLLIFSSGSSAVAREALTLQGRSMGTTWSIRYFPAAKGGGEPQAIHSGAGLLLKKINRLMSTYDEHSEISRFNRSLSTDWFRVSAETARVAAAAVEMSRRTGGAFDGTLGPVVSLWGFGPGAVPRKVPGKGALQQAMAETGWQQLQVRRHPPALRKARPGMSIDLSGIAKGYAVDELLKWMRYQKATAAMVEVGGEIRTFGNKPDGRPWAIGVERPVAGSRSLQRVVLPGTMAMATSGDYRNYFESGGKRYSHLIDPRSGRPVAHRLVSATVLAPDCMSADALATAMMVMGETAGMALAEKQGIPVLFMVKKTGGFEERMSPPFKAYLADNAEKRP